MDRPGKHSPRVRDLRRRIRHRRDGEVVVDGRRLVDDLVRWDIPIGELYLTEPLAGDPAAGRWIEAADQVFALDAEVLGGLAPTRNPQGVLAVVEEPRWPPWSAKAGVGVYLDGIQEPGNVGAIVRAAAGLGAAAVVLGPGSADPFGPVAVRGSAGAVFRIPVEWDIPLERAVFRIREQSGEIWATGIGGVSLDLWSPSPPTLLLLGTEGCGLSKAALDLADGVVTIPLERGIESLNVAVAAGIVLVRWRAVGTD